MWKVYLFSVLLAARVCLHCCESAVPRSFFSLSTETSICPPKLPLLDVLEFLPQDCFSSVKVWVTSLAQQYPQQLKIVLLLGVLQILAENLLLVYMGYYVASRVLTGIAKSICWLVALSLCVAATAYYMGLKHEMVGWTRYILGELYTHLGTMQHFPSF